MVDNESKDSRGDDNKLQSEGVMIAIVGGSKLVMHQVECSIGRQNENNLRY